MEPESPGLVEGEPRLRQVQSERAFRFVHLFSGPKDVLKEALMTEAKKEGISMKVESYDKLAEGAHDLSADSPYLELAESMDTIDGFHAGFPCGSFSMVRNKKGGPPPVRSREWPYGPPIATMRDSRRRRTRGRSWR